METNQAPTPTHVFDLNALLTAALMQAVNQATAPLIARIATLEERLSNITTASDERTMAIAEEVAERCIYAAGYDYDANNIDDKINEKIEEALDEYDMEDKIRDTIRDMSFSVSVD